jgi:hypothetical protein
MRPNTPTKQLIGSRFAEVREPLIDGGGSHRRVYTKEHLGGKDFNRSPSQGYLKTEEEEERPSKAFQELKDQSILSRSSI